MKETILAISGKPGLYRLVARGNGNLIVESIDEQKHRITAGSRDRARYAYNIKKQAYCLLHKKSPGKNSIGGLVRKGIKGYLE